uniref:T9SS type A sorting domain-containing protein n=1 Tax=candidate division WOR-3 bacterium TaxID=2052148 RepID=A0A7V0Z6X0_UNCW3
MKSKFIFYLLFPGFFLIDQSYRCNWQVVASGGNFMTGPYRIGSTVGQTAIGWMSTQNYIAHIGFWYSNIIQVSIKEQKKFGWNESGFATVRFYSPTPNPFHNTIRFQYMLDTKMHTKLQIFDITRRKTRTLINTTQDPGKYVVTWDGKDNLGRAVPSGVYICRFTAEDYHRNAKVVLQR